MPSLASDLESTFEALRRLIASLGGRRLACYGNSGGVFPALYYGRELKADAILCMAGRTNHTATFNAFSPRKDTTVDFASQFQHLELDGRRLFESHPHPPRICSVYGQDNWEDRRHAEHMAQLPCVTLRPVENFAEHNAVFELIRRNEYQPLLDWLIADPG